jgi:DNA-binding Lrp family transcriptional regulator
VHADLVCETRERLYEVVVESIRALPGVRDVDVLLYAKVVRDELSWRSPQA